LLQHALKYLFFLMFGLQTQQPKPRLLQQSSRTSQRPLSSSTESKNTTEAAKAAEAEEAWAKAEKEYASAKAETITVTLLVHITKLLESINLSNCLEDYLKWHLDDHTDFDFESFNKFFKEACQSKYLDPFIIGYIKYLYLSLSENSEKIRTINRDYTHTFIDWLSKYGKEFFEEFLLKRISDPNNELSTARFRIQIA
jgi:hypothetical protein